MVPGRYMIGSGDLRQVNEALVQLQTLITYLDTLSIGKTSDMTNCLDKMIETIKNAKSALNKAKIL